MATKKSRRRGGRVTAPKNQSAPTPRQIPAAKIRFRLAAWCIDMVAVSIGGLAALAAFDAVAILAGMKTFNSLWGTFAIMCAGLVLYPPLSYWRKRATWGQVWTRIQVVTDQDDPPGLHVLVLRGALNVAILVIWPLNVIWLIIRRRTFIDWLMNTRMVAVGR